MSFAVLLVRLGQRPPEFPLDFGGCIERCAPEKSLTHLLGGDRIAVTRQHLGVNAARDHLAVDQHAVAPRVSGDGVERVEIFPMTPGTLMIFAGRNSIHRVSAVRGAVPRMVALLSYDTRPDADSSEVFKYVRYGRSTPVSADV